MSNTYFIKDGYTPNKVVSTREDSDAGNYWTAERLRISRYYQFHVYKLASKLIRERGVKSVVDVGCGVATKLALLDQWHPGVSFTGIDQSHAIEFCRAHWEFGTWLVDDFDNPKLAGDALQTDLVICADVIEHLEDPDALLRYLYALVADTGVALVSTPDRDLLRGVDCVRSPNAFHIREWNGVEFRRYVEASGFDVVDTKRQLPVKMAFNRLTRVEVLRRVLRGQPARYNQVLVLRKKVCVASSE